jgi:hypothetical protein
VGFVFHKFSGEFFFIQQKWRSPLLIIAMNAATPAGRPRGGSGAVFLTFF